MQIRTYLAEEGDGDGEERKGSFPFSVVGRRAGDWDGGRLMPVFGLWESGDEWVVYSSEPGWQ